MTEFDLFDAFDHIDVELLARSEVGSCIMDLPSNE